jgi:hypothetical protein
VTWTAPYRRATVLLPSGPANDPLRKHLFIVVTDPCPSAGDVLMVSVSSTRPGHDPACLLYAGDHGFIQHNSFVEYALARIELLQKIQNGVARGLFMPRMDLNTTIFARVCHGVTISRFVRPRILEYYHARVGR